MGKKYSNNWGESPEGKKQKPGFAGKDTRLFSNQGAQDVSLTHGGRAKGISLTGR